MNHENPIENVDVWLGAAIDHASNMLHDLNLARRRLRALCRRIERLERYADQWRGAHRIHSLPKGLIPFSGVFGHERSTYLPGGRQ